VLSFDRLGRDSGRIGVEFLEREATPEPAMKVGIRPRVAGLSSSDTAPIPERLGVGHHRNTVHRWVRKAGVQSTDGVDPNHVAVDEAVVQPGVERWWLSAAVDSIRREPPRSPGWFSREDSRPTTKLVSSTVHRGCGRLVTDTDPDSSV
jgi:hypothetical protein